MTSLQSHPTSADATDAASDADPIARVDALLEVYLNSLDVYQRLREELSRSFSAGFLSLAHANRTGNIGSGRHYGEEGYDERMKAGRRVICSPEGMEKARAGRHQDDGKWNTQGAYHLMRYYLIEKNEGGSGHSKRPPDTITAEPLGVQDLAQDHSIASSHSCSALPTSASKSSKPKPKGSLDPLHWYGLLVPPSLRAAQTSFTKAVEHQIPQLLNVAAEMADLEMEIRRLRTDLGLSNGNGRDDGQTAQSLEGNGGEEATKEEGIMPPTQSWAVAPPTQAVSTNESPRKGRSDAGRKSVSSRPKEPRSGLLKMDG
jgi:coiled-coil domain-containing protein 115